jgi:hypothetical protein
MKDQHYGVLLSGPYYDLLVRFNKAKERANTWGELLEMLGPNGTEFVMGFTHTDGYVAQAEDRLQLIRDDVWVLYSDEFPQTQCAEESYAFYGHNFPIVEGAIRVTTEYGEDLCFYPKTSFPDLKTHLESLGHSLVYKLAGPGSRIYAY